MSDGTGHRTSQEAQRLLDLAPPQKSPYEDSTNLGSSSHKKIKVSYVVGALWSPLT